ncbi:hypothetical protein [Pedobacter montanisoli]|uniref:Uncharacterized protein n=1 Tax=Pedobacter montanisoli TaxID=2923277 RepID=A0ABS9ZS88_9SPHI|nr:hypothetical protein [Pedobacter montanisoli]MCJ0741112.1 hypothetical protein [Pedobacter montanisoli]
MKKLNLTYALVIILILFSAACKKDKGNSNNSAHDAKEFTTLFGPKVQTMQIDASTSNTFTLKGGTKITIPGGIFRKNGVTVTGTVTISAREFLDRSSILFGGANTNHISGAPLHSDGFIYLNASVNGVSVDKKLDQFISVSIPAKRTGITQIWEGAENVNNDNQFAWQAPLKNPNGANGIRMESNAIQGFYNFDMGNLGWINCDVFYSYTNPKTTVKVNLVNNPGKLASFMGLDGETFVYFCAKGSNVVAQLYTPEGPNAVKSYDDMMPVGAQGKYISFSIKGGKYYMAVQESTITANQVVTLNLTEVSEQQIQDVITSLNNY